MSTWVEQQVAAFYSLIHTEVTRWQGIEMALRESSVGGPPVWRDESVPLLQLCRLDMTRSDGTETSILTYQNNVVWGLYRNDSLPPLVRRLEDPDSIYRTRDMPELPTGLIGHVAVALDRGDIAEVSLDVDGHAVRLRAGEVYPERDGSLRVVLMDESVLAQVDGRRPESPSLSAKTSNEARHMALTDRQLAVRDWIAAAVAGRESPRIVYCREWLGHLPFGMYHWIEVEGRQSRGDLLSDWDADDLLALERCRFLERIADWQDPADEHHNRTTFTVHPETISALP